MGRTRTNEHFEHVREENAINLVPCKLFVFDAGFVGGRWSLLCTTPSDKETTRQHRRKGQDCDHPLSCSAFHLCVFRHDFMPRIRYRHR
jgi:hypothetical protein